MTATVREKVLVVDDDPVVLEIVREALQDAGYQVSTREQALGTAQWVAEERPDFVLLDVKMPALSGAELTQLIRRKISGGNIAVILHSGMEVSELNELATSTGAVGAIQKTPDAALFLFEFQRLTARWRLLKRRRPAES